MIGRDVMLKHKIGFVFMLLVLCAHLSGCAAAWFGGGAATGAVLEKKYMDNKKS